MMLAPSCASARLRLVLSASVALLFVACDSETPIQITPGDTGGDTTRPVGCANATDCPAPSNPCEVAVCVANLCGSSPAPAGTFVPDEVQLPGDCKTISCGDGGNFATAADPNDLPADDGNPCTAESCDGPNPVHPAVAAGASCGSDTAPGVCNGAGVCAECRPGEVTCDGITPRACDPDGAWVSEEPCPFVCSGAGQCTGVCVPGALDCQGLQPRVCNASGAFEPNGSACPFTCSAGACAGSCTPGALQCSGNIPQSCNAAGAWQDAAPCTFACANGQCTGVCVPGTERCQGTAVQTCGASGQWATTSACPYLCNNAECTGVCTPGAKRCVGRTSQICDGAGQWTDSQTCMFACSSGDCTGVCAPGETRCSGNLSQTCDSQGQWQTTQTCPFACLAGATCGGVCSPGATRCTGNNAETCDTNGQWQSTPCTFTCQNGSCTGVCSPGQTRCSGAMAQSCNVNGQWTTNQTCPFVCSGAGVCSGQCSPSSTRCSGTIPQSCDASGNWSSLADCTYACVNGNCTGVCRPGEKRCLGTASQTCDSTGQWQTSQNCPYVCSAGSCTGVCTPGTAQCSGNIPQTCDQLGQWSGSTACSDPAPICRNGACDSTSYAVSFQGGAQRGRVVIAQPPSLIGKPATIEVWLKLRTEQDYSTLFNTGGSFRAHYLGPVYGALRGAVSFFNDVSGTHFNSTSKVPLNEWFHLVASHDGTNLRMFINGKFAGSSTTVTSSLIDGKAPLGETNIVMQFGSTPRANNESLIGDIDELRISSGARYTVDFNPPARLESDATTVVLMRFDQGSGSTVQSDVPGGPTGTLLGTPLPTYVQVTR